MDWESFGVVRFDLGPLVQGQTRIAKLKSAYKLASVVTSWQPLVIEILHRHE